MAGLLLYALYAAPTVCIGVLLKKNIFGLNGFFYKVPILFPSKQRTRYLIIYKRNIPNQKIGKQQSMPTHRGDSHELDGLGRLDEGHGNTGHLKDNVGGRGEGYDGSEVN